ncbi:MAG: hypothetical protein JWN46_3559 [Acidimicrobiales bacterium]|nr:hypothetical protein [Acidimicrobiales bacterium]
MSLIGDEEPQIALANFLATVASDVDVFFERRDVLLFPIASGADVFGPLAEAWSSFRDEDMAALIERTASLSFDPLLAVGLSGSTLLAKLTVCGHARERTTRAWSVAAGQGERAADSFRQNLKERRPKARFLKQLLTWMHAYLLQVGVVLGSLERIVTDLAPFRALTEHLAHAIGVSATVVG